MNKKELAKYVALDCGTSIQQAEEISNSILRNITLAVSEGDVVEFVGFGSFVAKLRKKRKGFNLKTNEQIEIPARIVPVFRAGKKFKEQVNRKGF